MRRLVNLRSQKFTDIVDRLVERGWQEQQPERRGWIFVKSNGIRTMVVTVSSLQGAIIESHVHEPTCNRLYFLYTDNGWPVRWCCGCKSYVNVDTVTLQMNLHRQGLDNKDLCNRGK